MASVTGRTAESIDAILNDMVVSVRIGDNGHLIYQKRSGVEVDGGLLTNAALAAGRAWPVGSIFISAVPTNPNTLLGVGTWARFGKGRTLVSLDEAQTEFDGAEETGGAKEVTLTAAQIPTHTHTIPGHSHSIPPHSHPLTASYNTTKVAADDNGVNRMESFYFTSNQEIVRTGNTGNSAAGNTGSTADTPSGAAGSGGAHTNLPPYIVVYVWKRTA